MKTGHSLMIAFLLIGLIGSGVSAQKTAKPWTEWSEAEARKLLDDSPWAKTQAKEDNLNRSLLPLTQTDIRNVDSLGLNAALQSRLQVRFLSAQPIRQAFARIVELKQKSPSADLRQQLQSFVDRKFDDWIVVAVDFDSTETGNPNYLRQALANATTNSLKHLTYLETKGGQRLMLQEYKPPINDGLGAKFIFPRLKNGAPFLAADSGEVRFYTELSTFIRVNVRFKVAEMIHNGALEY